MAPEVEGFNTRGVTVNAVPLGAKAHKITSRHHVLSQANWRRTAVLTREADEWYWTGPIEEWEQLPDPTEEFHFEGYAIRYVITVFYDKNGVDGSPTYVPNKVADEYHITFAEDGRLCKQDLGGRWRTVDESGTGIRAGSSRPPNIPSDAHEFMRRSRGSTDAAPSQAAPVTLGVEHGSRLGSPGESTKLPRIGIDIGGVLSVYQARSSAKARNWHLTRDSEVPRAMLSVRELVEIFGPNNVFIISKAGPTMIQRSKEWLIETMAIAEITGMKPENIHFCSRISGPDGKRVIAKGFGITHMVDDHDEALKAVYDAQEEEGFPRWGHLFHFARSGVGPPPKCDKWRKQDRPEGVHAVSSWNEVIHLLNVETHQYWNYVDNDDTPMHTPTKETQYRTSLPCSCTDQQYTEEASPDDSWIDLRNYSGPPSELYIPAMPLLTEDHIPHAHRGKLEDVWFPFPAAVTRMLSKKEAKAIPEAMEAT